jgi:hypothetical protein
VGVRYESNRGRKPGDGTADNVSPLGPTSGTLRGLLEGAPARDIQLGTEIGRFRLRPGQMTSAIAALSGNVLGALSIVLEGHRTWRDAGSDAAELFLRALGIPAETALSLATNELPLQAFDGSAPEELPGTKRGRPARSTPRDGDAA